MCPTVYNIVEIVNYKKFTRQSISPFYITKTSAINNIAVLTSNQNVMPPRNIDKFV